MPLQVIEGEIAGTNEKPVFYAGVVIKPLRLTGQFVKRFLHNVLAQFAVTRDIEAVGKQPVFMAVIDLLEAVAVALTEFPPIVSILLIHRLL